MSKLSHCPRGGMMGISLTRREMATFSLLMGRNFIDEVIPLPGKTPQEQKNAMQNCTHEDADYWEDETGSHGWCCSQCGEVVQWG